MCARRGITHYLSSPSYRTYLQPAVAPEFIPTPPTAMHIMLAALRPTSEDILYDLGCGDGRFLIAAVESYGCRALGIEINPATAALARRRVAASPAKERIRIVVGDARRYDLSQATIVTFYLDPELVAQLTPKLTGARAIASYQHDMFDRTTIRVRHTDHPIYVWRR
jgi:SAM-dependent methyltransferase